MEELPAAADLVRVDATELHRFMRDTMQALVRRVHALEARLHQPAPAPPDNGKLDDFEARLRAVELLALQAVDSVGQVQVTPAAEESPAESPVVEEVEPEPAIEPVEQTPAPQQVEETPQETPPSQEKVPAVEPLQEYATVDAVDALRSRLEGLVESRLREQSTDALRSRLDELESRLREHTTRLQEAQSTRLPAAQTIQEEQTMPVTTQEEQKMPEEETLPEEPTMQEATQHEQTMPEAAQEEEEETTKDELKAMLLDRIALGEANLGEQVRRCMELQETTTRYLKNLAFNITGLSADDDFEEVLARTKLLRPRTQKKVCFENAKDVVEEQLQQRLADNDDDDIHAQAMRVHRDYLESERQLSAGLRDEFEVAVDDIEEDQDRARLEHDMRSKLDDVTKRARAGRASVLAALFIGHAKALSQRRKSNNDDEAKAWTSLAGAVSSESACAPSPETPSSRRMTAMLSAFDHELAQQKTALTARLTVKQRPRSASSTTTESEPDDPPPKLTRPQSAGAARPKIVAPLDLPRPRSARSGSIFTSRVPEAQSLVTRLEQLEHQVRERPAPAPAEKPPPPTVKSSLAAAQDARRALQDDDESAPLLRRAVAEALLIEQEPAVQEDLRPALLALDDALENRGDWQACAREFCVVLETSIDDLPEDAAEKLGAVYEHAVAVVQAHTAASAAAAVSHAAADASRLDDRVDAALADVDRRHDETRALYDRRHKTLAAQIHGLMAALETIQTAPPQQPEQDEHDDRAGAFEAAVVALRAHLTAKASSSQVDDLTHAVDRLRGDFETLTRVPPSTDRLKRELKGKADRTEVARLLQKVQSLAEVQHNGPLVGKLPMRCLSCEKPLPDERPSTSPPSFEPRVVVPTTLDYAVDTKRRKHNPYQRPPGYPGKLAPKGYALYGASNKRSQIQHALTYGETPLHEKIVVASPTMGTFIPPTTTNRPMTAQGTGYRRL